MHNVVAHCIVHGWILGAYIICVHKVACVVRIDVCVNGYVFVFLCVCMWKWLCFHSAILLFCIVCLLLLF